MWQWLPCLKTLCNNYFILFNHIVYNLLKFNLLLCNFGKNSTQTKIFMQSQYFQDFDAFVETVRGVDSVMLLQNPQRRFWSINNIKLPEVNIQLTHQLQEIVRQIMIAAEHSQFESSFAAKCAEVELLKVVSLLIEQQQRGESHKKRRPKVPRQEIILHCRTLIEERGSESILVGELATNAGVSERTLRTAFNEYYGVGPIRYLQLRRIHLVHLALRAADPETESVTNVLLRHGQWEFGRFAKLYHQLYGELPSETLRAKSR